MDARGLRGVAEAGRGVGDVDAPRALQAAQPRRGAAVRHGAAGRAAGRLRLAADLSPEDGRAVVRGARGILCG